MRPNFFPGNIANIIRGCPLKKMIPPMMDTGGGGGGGARGSPAAHGTYGDYIFII